MPGKGGHSIANALKTMCPNLEGVVRSFIVVFQRGHDQLVDLLLIGWWGGKWESASSTFCSQPVWGLHACGQHKFLPPGEGFCVCKTAQRYCYVYPLRGNKEPAPRLHYFFFWLVLLSLISICLDLLLELREGQGGWMKSISCNQEMGVGRGFPGGAVVENPPANAGNTGSSPGLGRSHMPRSKWAREPQLLSLCVWSLCSATREVATVRGPRTAMKSGPR